MWGDAEADKCWGVNSPHPSTPERGRR